MQMNRSPQPMTSSLSRISCLHSSKLLQN